RPRACWSWSTSTRIGAAHASKSHPYIRRWRRSSRRPSCSRLTSTPTRRRRRSTRSNPCRLSS
ncbi:unnamed protein product, partial [Ectocarpus fasciculatus]